MSKKLTSVILSSVLPGDEAEPYKLDISHDDIQQKEIELFDNEYLKPVFFCKKIGRADLVLGKRFFF